MCAVHAWQPPAGRPHSRPATPHAPSRGSCWAAAQHSCDACIGARPMRCSMRIFLQARERQPSAQPARQRAATTPRSLAGAAGWLAARAGQLRRGGGGRSGCSTKASNGRAATHAPGFPAVSLAQRQLQLLLALSVCGHRGGVG
jgi:hypothetical protein